MTSTELLQLARHMDWADDLVWKTVLDLPAAREDPRIRDLLYHAHTVQAAYAQILRGEQLSIPEPDTFQDLDALHRWGSGCRAELRTLVSGLDAEALDRGVSFPWAEQLREHFGTARGADARQAILQVTLHSTYHRGQINARIRELGGEPPLTDFIAWVWSGQPDA